MYLIYRYHTVKQTRMRLKSKAERPGRRATIGLGIHPFYSIIEKYRLPYHQLALLNCWLSRRPLKHTVKNGGSCPIERFQERAAKEWAFRPEVSSIYFVRRSCNFLYGMFPCILCTCHGVHHSHAAGSSFRS